MNCGMCGQPLAPDHQCNQYMTQPKQKKEWMKRFDERFGTGIDREGMIIDGEYQDTPLDYDDLKSFISSEISLALKQERERIVREIEAIRPTTKDFNEPCETYHLVRNCELIAKQEICDQAIKIVEEHGKT